MTCSQCGAAPTLRRKGHAAGWHLVTWCARCEVVTRPGHWVPHARLSDWGFLWLDEVPLLPSTVTRQGVLL